MCHCGTMMDVGAGIGRDAKMFAFKGHTVYAFEPYSRLRKSMENLVRRMPDLSDNLIPRSEAIGLVDSSGQPLWHFTGCFCNQASLMQWDPSMVSTYSVPVTRLDTFMQQHDVSHVDFLKVTLGGAQELHVLQSYPWSIDTSGANCNDPCAIVCSFDVSLCVASGYAWTDIPDFLVQHGYHTLVSEWDPSDRRHRQLHFCAYPCALDFSGNGLGNMMAFKDCDMCTKFINDHTWAPDPSANYLMPHEYPTNS